MIKTDLIGLLFLVLALDKALHVKLIIRCNNMIKLTRGALTMLLAQYRGILKNAWIKNFAVAAALATTVTTAYADPAKVTTWDAAVKTGEGAVALDGETGVLNIQTTAEWKENPGTITITGGENHKIGDPAATADVSIFAEKKNSEKAPVGSIVIDTTGVGATDAKLTIANNQNKEPKSKTGVRIYSADVKAGDSKKANLTVSTLPNFGPDYKDDEEQYVNIQKLTVDGANASVNVTNGELDVNNQLTITNGAKVDVEASGTLWMGNSDVDSASVNVEDGTLTSNGKLYIDSSRLKVGEKGEVKVSNFLYLDDVGPVDINKLTDVGEGKEGKITLTAATDIEGNKLALTKKTSYVSTVKGLEVTLGGKEYENDGDGLVDNVTVGSKLTASAIVKDGEKTKDATYQIRQNETITLDTSFNVDDGLYANKSGKGEVASDLEVAGGKLNVDKGEWTAQGLTLTDGSVTVESNAALALKTLEIANGKTLSVAKQDDVAGVLDLTNTKLVNDTAESEAKVKGTIENKGVVKITSDKLNAAIANEDKNKGYIFDNKNTGVIEVAGPATLATTSFLAPTATNPGIKNTGTLAVDGALTVNGDKDKASTLENAGTISAASLTLNGKAYSDAKGANNADSKFTLGGTNDQFIIDGVVGANTDTLVVAGKVAAQSIGARILDITGQVGADETNHIGSVKTAVGSISATVLTTKTGAIVNADAIKADTIDFSGTVNAGNVEATKDLKVTAGDTTVEGVLTAAKLTQEAGSLKVKGALNVTGDATVVKGTTTLDAATANIGTLIATTAGALDLTNASTATVGSFNGLGADKDTVTIGEGSTLTITANQYEATDKAIFKNNTSGDAITGKKGTLAVNADALDLKKVESAVVYSAENKFAKGSIGVLKINGADSAIGADKINNDNLDKLITALSADGGNKFDGKLQLVGVTADISDIKANKDGNATDGSLDYTKVKALAQLAGDTTLESQTIKVDTDPVSGDVGNLVADKGKTSVLIGDATLQGSGSSTATNGYYVSAVKGDDAKKVVLAGATLKNANSSLTLAGQGKIGAVTGEGALNVTGNANVVEVDAEGKEVAADIGKTSEKLGAVNVSGALTAANIYTKALESSGSVTAAKIEAGKATVEGGVVNATNLKTSDVATIKAGSVNVGYAEFTGALTMEGGALTATKNTDAGATGKVELKAGANIKAGTIVAEEVEVSGAKLESAGNITAGNLTAKDEATIKAGSVNADVASFEKALTMEGGVVNAKKVSLADTTTIKGNANLIADELTVTGGNKTIRVGTDKAGDIAGSAGFLFAKNFVGAANTKIVVDPEFENNTSLGGAAAFAGTNKLNADIVIGKNAIFAYDKNLTVEQLKSLTSKYNLSDAANGIGSLLVVNSAIDLTTNGINVGKDQISTNDPDANKLVLSQNGALAVGGTALANAKVNANNSQEAAVTVANVEYDDSSKVLLDGGVKAGAQYQIFSGTVAGDDLQASSLNGFYTATIGDDGKTTKVAANRSVLSQLTTPLYEHLLAVTGNGNKGAGVQFLEKVASESLDGGKDAETVARLGAFGGLYNAAYNVNKTSADAIAARTAMGNNGVQQVATNNAIGGAVWLSPIYKNVKADSLESDGKESGADVKLTGVALGADVTTANNVRLGAMFNLGSGDTDGNKLGSRAENDFDYFGFGVYAAYNYGNFGVAADATYAKVDNDLSASSSLGYGYFKSSVDTNVYSLGLTAKYAFDTNFATITPHAGIRYTSLNADSYDVESAYGTLATTSYDSASVVSFPVGVTFTKDIKVNAWKVQPTFDVTLTANAGDTEAEYDTYFTGADSKVKLESEFVDSFTYGLTAGFEAQHESGVALGLGVNYEGSSNTNSYGVTGNVRYTF